jgi:hypothetical protein
MVFIEKIITDKVVEKQVKPQKTITSVEKRLKIRLA